VLGAKKQFPVFLDESALAFPHISVSAGMRGLQIIVAPGDYARATQAVRAQLVRPTA